MKTSIEPDGVPIEVAWDMFSVGSSVFVPCVNTVKASQQIKHVTAQYSFGNYSPSERTKASFTKFEEKYVGKIKKMAVSYLSVMELNQYWNSNKKVICLRLYLPFWLILVGHIKIIPSC